MSSFKPSTRALRRHHYERLKAARSHYFSGRSAPLSPSALGKVADTPCLCSCFMCGNPRKWHGELSFQELKADQPRFFLE